MKYLILCPEDKRIIYISTSLEYNKLGGLILDSGIQVAPNVCEVEQVLEIPENIEVEKYCYIHGKYVLNENFEE